MKILSTSGLMLAVGLLLSGCATHEQDLRRAESLRNDPAWPMIRSTAKLEISKHEGGTRWSEGAYYTPRRHANGVWVLVASGQYPLNKLGENVDMVIRDDGTVVACSPRPLFYR